MPNICPRFFSLSRVHLATLHHTLINPHGTRSTLFAPSYSSSLRVAQIPRDTQEVSSDRYRLGGFRRFCTVKDSGNNNNIMTLAKANYPPLANRKSGNNNNIMTLAKANYPPCGIDYPAGPTGRFTNGRTYVDFIDLSTKKCVPCNSDTLKAMTEEAAKTLICQVPEWNLINQDGILKLQRSWKTKTFMKGLEFFQAVADVAEAEGHHPDLHLVGWNNVKIDIWTHSVAGLTENDFILAAKISGLNLPHLLRKQAGK